MSSLFNTSRFSGLVRPLHRIPLLRRMARQLARGLVLTQDFHGGRIAFNAVSHSWAWTGACTYENFDRPVQDRLLALSESRPRLLDVGANIGVMTLSVLLRNRAARALVVEPGNEAVALLLRSLRLNRLEERCEVLHLAASAGAEKLPFDASGSVMGHVVAQGPEVAAAGLATLIGRVAADGPFLGKLDVEGYETELIPALTRVSAPAGSCLVMELHPHRFNGMGDPAACLAQLRARFCIRALGGEPLGEIDPESFTQVEVHWQ